MAMKKTREALGTLGFTHDVSQPMQEVQVAEELAGMLREVCEAHWLEGDVRGKVRKAEALLSRLRR